jgi:hypothetical protein
VGDRIWVKYEWLDTKVYRNVEGYLPDGFRVIERAGLYYHFRLSKYGIDWGFDGENLLS